MLEVEDERRREQDADQAGDEREPVGEHVERLEPCLEVADPLGAGRPGIEGEAGAEPILVVGVRHGDACRDQQGSEQTQDGEGDHRLRSLQAPADPGHDGTASRGVSARVVAPGL